MTKRNDGRVNVALGEDLRMKIRIDALEHEPPQTIAQWLIEAAEAWLKAGKGKRA